MARLTHVALRVRDTDAARRFYESGLGLRYLGTRSPGGRAFDLSDGHLNMTVLGYRGPEREAHEEGAEHIHIGFVVPDARAAFDRLLAMDATFVRNGVKGRGEPLEAPSPDGSFKVADPDANIVDVSGNPREWRY